MSIMARPVGTKYIQTPEKLWELFETYKTITLKDKITLPQSHVKLGVVYLDYYPPLTEQDFERWLANEGVISVIRDYFTNRDNRYDDYVTIISRIKNEIYAHNFKYASIGAFKENLIARQLGLTDSQKMDLKAEITNVKANFGSTTIQPPSESKDNS
jgi:hypothetical protein